jgi:hypothetical protein
VLDDSVVSVVSGMKNKEQMPTVCYSEIGNLEKLFLREKMTTIFAALFV